MAIEKPLKLETSWEKTVFRGSFALGFLAIFALASLQNAHAEKHSAAETPGLLARRYQEGEKLSYHMKGVNENWRYEIQADGVVKRDSSGTYFEEYAWSHLISDGVPVTLSPTTLNFRQIVSLAPETPPSLPNLSEVDHRLIGPITDWMTFYVDLWLANRLKKLSQAGDHFYFKRGTPSSWADGNYVSLGEDSIDFDFTLKDVNQTDKIATLLVRLLSSAFVHQALLQTTYAFKQSTQNLVFCLHKLVYEPLKSVGRPPEHVASAGETVRNSCETRTSH